MKNYAYIIIIYWLIISAAAVYLTVKDKAAAKAGKWRVPEATLMLVGLFGGAEAMYATRKKIRHKTKHKKFMIGLPAEIILHILIIVAIFLLTK